MLSKADNTATIDVGVQHPWHPGDEFTFQLTKQMSEAATAAQRDYFALPDETRPEVRRRKLIQTIGELLTTEPGGFDDFPQDGRPLAERVVEYFDDPEHPELNIIIVAAWNKYWEVSVPRAFLKSHENHGARDGQLPTVSH